MIHSNAWAPFDLAALFYHLQSNLVAAQDAVTVSLQRGKERNTWNRDVVYVCLCVFVYLRMAA